MSSSFPSILSLHPTANCLNTCPFCYLKQKNVRIKKEKKIIFFTSIIDCLPKLGIREIAMSVNYINKENANDKNLVALIMLSKLAKKNKLRFSITTNHENVNNFDDKIFQYCDLVSLSFDEYKVNINNNSIKSFLNAIKKLKSYIKIVNVNLLLTKQVIDMQIELIKKVLYYADSIYLIVPKLIQLDFKKEQLIGFLFKVRSQFMNFETFVKINIDNCIKPSIYPFSALVPYCERGRNLISMNPFGGLSYCTFDTPFIEVNNDIEFIKVVNDCYKKHPQGFTKRCPFIKFT